MTKHSVGIFCTTPYSVTHDGAAWAREDPHITQGMINALPAAAVASTPEGRGRVETYTVMHAGDSTPITIAGARATATVRQPYNMIGMRT